MFEMSKLKSVDKGEWVTFTKFCTMSFHSDLQLFNFSVCLCPIHINERNINKQAWQY